MRQDMISKEWVIIAPGRAKRPNQNHQAAETRPPVPQHRPDCPFCPGNEAQTPGSLLSFPQRPGDAGGSEQVRRAQPRSRTTPRWSGRKARRRLRHGEVIVETPRHYLPRAPAPRHVAQTRGPAEALPLMDDPRHSPITIFRNHGPG
jgi:UDPglucose--hexose-1-phosphate uridylyltransferase